MFFIFVIFLLMQKIKQICRMCNAVKNCLKSQSTHPRDPFVWRHICSFFWRYTCHHSTCQHLKMIILVKKRFIHTLTQSKTTLPMIAQCSENHKTFNISLWIAFCISKSYFVKVNLVMHLFVNVFCECESFLCFLWTKKLFSTEPLCPPLLRFQFISTHSSTPPKMLLGSSGVQIW